MASTKTARTIIAAATSNTAGSTTTGTVVDLTTKYGGFLTAKITNGATGPTIAASAYIYTSHDNSAFKLMAQCVASVANNAISEFAFDIPAGVMYLRVDVKDNTAQTVTCESFMQELTTV